MYQFDNDLPVGTTTNKSIINICLSFPHRRSPPRPRHRGGASPRQETLSTRGTAIAAPPDRYKATKRANKQDNKTNRGLLQSRGGPLLETPAPASGEASRSTLCSNRCQARGVPGKLNKGCVGGDPGSCESQALSRRPPRSRYLKLPGRES